MFRPVAKLVHTYQPSSFLLDKKIAKSLFFLLTCDASCPCILNVHIAFSSKNTPNQANSTHYFKQSFICRLVDMLVQLSSRRLIKQPSIQLRYRLSGYLFQSQFRLLRSIGRLSCAHAYFCPNRHTHFYAAHARYGGLSPCRFTRPTYILRRCLTACCMTCVTQCIFFM